ncbi:MAG TPA: pyridoxamine 5'-phosphate oxidase family protein [Streptosporangiaceae bacterium]|nr:pyridoxamine 5'-phosphate oxidase family protein [Streptosporangiaceae bacterium]
MLDPDVRRVLDGASIAHLATILPDGSPHTTPVYVGTHGDRVVFFTGPGMRKARNLRRDPRMALSIAPADNPFMPVVVRGRVVEWIEGDPSDRPSASAESSDCQRATFVVGATVNGKVASAS